VTLRDYPQDGIISLTKEFVGVYDAFLYRHGVHFWLDPKTNQKDHGCDDSG
jgi:hypothetical protein